MDFRYLWVIVSQILQIQDAVTSQTEISLETLVEDFYKVTMEAAFDQMEQSVENLGK